MSKLHTIFREKYEHQHDPNEYYKYRPDEINSIIIHSMGQYIGNTHAKDFLKSLQLSAHKLIEPDGKVWECVDVTKQAYHAGTSVWKGQTNINTSSVGIEVLIQGHHNYNSFLSAIKRPETFTDAQYDSCAVECALLIDKYDIPMDNVVRHSDVSGDHVRGIGKGKKDVGSGWNMSHFKALTAEFVRQLKASEK